MSNLINLIPAGNQGNIYAMRLPNNKFINGKFDVHGHLVTSYKIYIPQANGKWLVTKRIRKVKEDLKFQVKKVNEIYQFRLFLSNMKK